MTRSVVTPERFAKGMTFDEYVKWAGSPENLAREAFGSYYADGGSIGAARRASTGTSRRQSEDQSSEITRIFAGPFGCAASHLMPAIC